MTAADSAPAGGPGARVALAGGLLLGLATPPALLPFGEWLVLPGLMAWFAVSTAARRPLWCAWLFGCVHMAWFSWSLRHVLLGGYVAIVLVGGLYYLLGTAAVRAAPSRWRALAFAVACAGTFWLRAAMPEIHYPHGQPVHALWQWPALMRVVVVGGEPLGNALLGSLAAALVGLWRSWRVGQPEFWRARRSAAVAATAALAAVGLGNVLLVGHGRPDGVAAPARPVRVVAIEPGYHPEEIWRDPRGWRAAYRDALAQRLLAPTRAAVAADDPPDLVLWPESAVLENVPVDALAHGRVALLRGELPDARSTRLLLGANVHVGDDPRAPGATTPAALLLELPSGRVLGHHEKQRLVPGGEFLPLVSLLPDGLAASLRRLFAETLGTPPDCRPGAARPLLETAAGVPFGAMLCYDNAFPGPARDLVGRGARLLVVLSNEAWYRGGGELTQLLAMTIVRALETGAPVVRCTLDGRSVAVDAGGRVLDGLPLEPAPRATARNLAVSLAPGPGRLPPMAWLRRAVGPGLGALTLLAALHALWRWVRLRSARTALPAAAAPGASGAGRGGS